MLGQKKQNFIFIKIGFYVLIFLAIIYTMRYTRSANFADQIGIFFGPSPSSFEQKSNWCSPSIQLVAWIEKDKFVTGADQIAGICSLTSTAYSAEDIKDLQWKPLLTAKDSQGKEDTLESDPSFVFLRSKGLIYKSPQFKSQLEKVFSQK